MVETVCEPSREGRLFNLTYMEVYLAQLTLAAGYERLVLADTAACYIYLTHFAGYVVC